MHSQVGRVAMVSALGLILYACSDASDQGKDDGGAGDASGDSSLGGTFSGGEASIGGTTGGDSNTGGKSDTGGMSVGGGGGATVVAGDPPSIFLIADIGTTPGMPFPKFVVHFYDDYTAAEDVTIEVASSDETFLPVSGIVLGAIQNEGSPDVGHFYRELTLSPTTLAAGNATITLTMEDGAGQKGVRSFKASINASALNDAKAVSVSSGASPELGNSYSLAPALSGDGSLVFFESNASNLGAGASVYTDIYVHDTVSLSTSRITGGLGRSERPKASPDGRYVAFYSSAPLVAADTNGVADCYLYDSQTMTFEQISVTDGEGQADAPSLPGEFASSRPAISDDGRYVAFVSSATNLVTGDTNSKQDVFVRDRTAGTTTLVSVSTSGALGDADSDQPTMSGDGSKIAFASFAKTLVDGVADTDSRSDVYLRSGGATLRISKAHASSAAANGTSDYPELSGDGTVLAFSSAATNLGPAIEFYGHTDIWLYDIAKATFQRINLDQATDGTQGYCSGPSLSNDGKKLVFTSMGSFAAHVIDTPQTISYDVASGAFQLASLNNVASVPNGGTSYGSVVSRNGNVIAFQTAASDIIFGDTNGSADIFVTPF